MSKGFTLIELIVVIAIIAVLSAIILFNINQYINKGKDAGARGYLSALIPAGEDWYKNHNNSYKGFCDPTQSAAIRNIIAEMPQNHWGCPDRNQAGLCCQEALSGNSWAAYATNATDDGCFCVDSRGVQQTQTSNLCPFSSSRVNQVISCYYAQQL